jgi:hypothetical protein
MRKLISAAFTSPAVAQSTWQSPNWNAPGQRLAPPPPPVIHTPQGSWQGSTIGNTTWWHGPNGQTRSCTVIGQQTFCN